MKIYTNLRGTANDEDYDFHYYIGEMDNDKEYVVKIKDGDTFFKQKNREEHPYQYIDSITYLIIK